MQAKYDSRVTTLTTTNLYANGVNPSTNYVLAVDQTSMFGVGYAYVCSALSRGWLANAPTSNYPAAAYYYISQLWNAFANGTIPQSQQLPYWMWAFGRAIAAKSVPKGNGQAYYKADWNQVTVPDAIYSLGPSLYNVDGLLYVPGTGNIDLFPKATAPQNYISEASAAFLALCGFMSRSSPCKETRMCSNSVITSLDKDVSSFCNLAQVTGTGGNNVGGLSFLAELEVPIFRPIFAPLQSFTRGTFDQENGNLTRFPNRAHQFSGDQLFTTYFCSSLVREEYWNTKCPPKFKFIDFLEFLETLAMFASQAVSQFWKDAPSKIVTSFNQSEQVSAAVCPITLQELGILLRNEMLFLMGNQAGVQSIYQAVPKDVNDSQFTPFAVGTNTCCTQSIKLKLPLPMVENMKSLVIHTLKHGPNAYEFLIPVLGQYYATELDPDDYQFTSYDSNDQPVLTNTFAAVPKTRNRQVDKKTGKEGWVETTSEPVISFIDGSSGNDYVFLNDLTRLQNLASLWNEWISTYEPYTSPMTIVNVDPGINVLASLNQTIYWAAPSVQYLLRTLETEDLRITQNRGLSSAYSQQQAVAISYKENPFGATQDVTTKWILPVCRLQNGDTTSDSESFIKLTSLYEEQFSSSLSTTGESGITFASRHYTYAASMVHGRDGQSLLDKQLVDLNEKGQAGILSSLAASFLGNAFGKDVGAIASTVANALPI